MPDLAIWLRDGGTDDLPVRGGAGAVLGAAHRAGPARSGWTRGWWAARSLERRPVWTPDVLADPRIELSEDARRLDRGGRGARRSWRCRSSASTCRGPWSRTARAGARFTDREVEYLSVFANQVASALENARLYEALESARRGCAA